MSSSSTEQSETDTAQTLVSKKNSTSVLKQGQKFTTNCANINEVPAGAQYGNVSKRNGRSFVTESVCSPISVLYIRPWLACGTSYRVTADIFSIPLPSVCRIVHKVVEEMMIIIHRAIHFPTADEMEEVGAGFSHLAGHEAFRHAAGAIDGCHIRIVPPKNPQKRCYINRNLFPSLLLQGVCDANGKFLDVYIGNPALKTRWRNIFLRALEIRPLFAPKVIGTCCILHNMCDSGGGGGGGSG
ncbi:hypothetical protein F2P81_013212 [Scophthalmus maximus]|uniref:DDE Tnp4 domain-containing protein n=1 Tax=Scophthalmus maximus TaxID=52904 RepID=A0A6A4SWL3_SCOMX|nr:hypothetical protein F2P81_013212 [Scophthalmus maximus]